MTINIPEELKTGTHRVNFHVLFTGNVTCDRVDSRFTYKRLNSKLKALCRKAGRQMDSIKTVLITKE